MPCGARRARAPLRSHSATHSPSPVCGPVRLRARAHVAHTTYEAVALLRNYFSAHVHMHMRHTGLALRVGLGFWLPLFLLLLCLLLAVLAVLAVLGLLAL